MLDISVGYEEKRPKCLLEGRWCASVSVCVRNATSGCKETGRRGTLKGARLQTVETATEPMAHDSGRPKPGESDWVWPSRQEEPDGDFFFNFFFL